MHNRIIHASRIFQDGVRSFGQKAMEAIGLARDMLRSMLIFVRREEEMVGARYCRKNKKLIINEASNYSYDY